MHVAGMKPRALARVLTTTERVASISPRAGINGTLQCRRYEASTLAVVMQRVAGTRPRTGKPLLVASTTPSHWLTTCLGRENQALALAHNLRRRRESSASRVNLRSTGRG